jgi:hypothetical protein
MVVQEIPSKLKMYSMEEYNKQLEALDVKMICENCKKIYDHLFNLRKKELAKLQKEIEKSFKEKEEDYCQCMYPLAVKKENKIYCLTCDKIIKDACTCLNPEMDIYSGRCLKCRKVIYRTSRGY